MDDRAGPAGAVIVEDEPSPPRSYPKTIAIAIGACLAAWLGWNVVRGANMLVRISQSGATGLAFVLGGILEGLVTSFVLGLLVGTAWYFIRRHWENFSPMSCSRS